MFIFLFLPLSDVHSIETSISVEVDIRDTNENPTSVPVQNVIEKEKRENVN